MCAIFVTAGTVNIKLIKEISKKQIFRGPDAQNFYHDEANLVSLGSNRLSVIDKEKGTQPMFSNDKNLVIVFNGCIYNFLEIKKYLKSKNINFYTNSDTEVVIKAYSYFGEKAFNYFDGMWSLAIYDKIKNKLILSRDYVGQKPLFYTKKDNYYIFSSQLDGLFVDQNIAPKISKENLIKYYAYSFIPAPETLYENIYQVEPGENILIDLKKFDIIKKKYWDISNGADYNIFFNKIEKKNFKKKFENIIEQHSIADKVPVVSLSGGIDSYIIMDYFTKNKRSCSTFTLGFENKTYDESQHVLKIDKKIDKKIYKTTDTELKSNFLKIAKNLSDPIGDSSILPTYIIHNKIKDHSNVCLSGDGGDEAFFGYITFDAFYLARIIKKALPNFILKILRKIFNLTKISYDYITLSTKLRRFFNSIHLEQKYLLSSWMSCLNSEDMSLLFKEKIDENKIYDDLNNLFTKNRDMMKNSQLYYYKYYLPMILTKVDQASMYNSVETRSPFLSKDIINFSLNADLKTLYKFLNKKYFVKNIFKDEIPPNILNRKKHGFAFPKEIILQDKKFVDKLLDFNLLTNEHFFNEKYKSFLEKKSDYSQYIWNELILNLSLQNILNNKKTN